MRHGHLRHGLCGAGRCAWRWARCWCCGRRRAHWLIRRGIPAARDLAAIARVIGLATLGQNLRLFHPLLAVDAAVEVERLVDLLHVGGCPACHVFKSRHAAAFQAPLGIFIDGADALKVIARQSSCGRLCRGGRRRYGRCSGRCFWRCSRRWLWRRSWRDRYGGGRRRSRLWWRTGFDWRYSGSCSLSGGNGGGGRCCGTGGGLGHALLLWRRLWRCLSGNRYGRLWRSRRRYSSSWPWWLDRRRRRCFRRLCWRSWRGLDWSRRRGPGGRYHSRARRRFQNGGPDLDDGLARNIGGRRQRGAQCPVKARCVCDRRRGLGLWPR